ncbi:hypothetical protein MLD38_039340 [Melastoma candidum]|uniref:Uncharacterized protein n=1 Tax=Melastoma candidum TaxID=119954 RepID=A0ACB9L2I6_9MYRT|nr:hypothetical protein MLD38_039340 [Melastoma candidum]
MKYLSRAGSHSFSNQRDRSMSNLTRLAVNSRRLDGRPTESPPAIANQEVITQLSEQISTLIERMDEFTSRMEELTSKINVRNILGSQQNLAPQPEACNGSGPTSLFITGLGNGSLTGSMLPHSTSSSQLAKDLLLMEEILVIARAQRKIMHQLDSLSNIAHEYWGERTGQARIDNRTTPLEAVAVPVMLALGSFSLFLYKTFASQK